MYITHMYTYIGWKQTSWIWYYEVPIIGWGDGFTTRDLRQRVTPMVPKNFITNEDPYHTS